MNITEMGPGDRGTVAEVNCPPELKERLFSLRVRPGEEICLLKISFFRKTFLISAAGSRIALGKEVAECVNVCRA